MLVGPETTVICFQNGVDNERRITEEVGESHDPGGIVYIFSTTASPRTVALPDPRYGYFNTQ